MAHDKMARWAMMCSPIAGQIWLGVTGDWEFSLCPEHASATVVVNGLRIHSGARDKMRPCQTAKKRMEKGIHSIRLVVEPRVIGEEERAAANAKEQSAKASEKRVKQMLPVLPLMCGGKTLANLDGAINAPNMDPCDPHRNQL